MPQQYDELSKADVHRDEHGTVRSVLHIDQFYRSQARTAQLASQDYLMHMRSLLGLEDSELHSLGLGTETNPTEDGAEFRLSAEKTQFDTTTVTYSQTYFGLPVWEAGLSVQIKTNPFRVVSAQSTAHAHLHDGRRQRRSSACVTLTNTASRTAWAFPKTARSLTGAPSRSNGGSCLSTDMTPLSGCG